jgi:hypothetical protein
MSYSTQQTNKAAGADDPAAGPSATIELLRKKLFRPRQQSGGRNTLNIKGED